MAMGAIRPPAYSAPVRTYLDGVRDNRINWYFVDDDTPFYEELHAFSPARDEMYTPSDTPELSGLNPNPRTYASGLDPFHHDPHGVHGDVDDFLCLSPASKFAAPGETPDDPCGEGKYLLPPSGIKFAFKYPPPSVEPFPLGLMLGNTISESSAYPLISRLNLGTVILTPKSDKGPMKQGAAFGLILNNGTGVGGSVSSTLLTGLNLRDNSASVIRNGLQGALVLTDPIRPPLESGLLLGLDTRAGSVLDGLALGLVVTDAPLPPPPLKTGVEFGLTFAGSEILSGLEFGFTTDDGTPPDEPPVISEPDHTCDNLYPTFAYSPFQIMLHSGTHIVRFPMEPGTTYHMSYEVLEYSIGGVTIYKGNTCADKFWVANLTPLFPCASWSSDGLMTSYPYFFLEFAADLIEVSLGHMPRVNFSWGTGGCP